MKTDVVIIGAGPGGTVCAQTLLKHNINCIIIEKDEFPRYHIGESLTGGVGELLKEFGLHREMTKAKFPIKYGVKVYGEAENTFWVPVKKRNPDGTLVDANTWQVSRDKFDLILLNEARERGAKLINGKALQILKSGDKLAGVQVEISDGSVIEINCKYVVDASGINTFCSQQGLTSKKNRGNYCNQIAVYSQLNGALFDDGKEIGNTLLFHKNKNHWAWFIPIDDQRVSVGIVSPSSYIKSKNESIDEFFQREIKEIHPELYKRLKTAKIIEDVRKCSNYSYEIDKYHGNGFLCIGDAHRFIDPVFSFGVHFSVHEAKLAANAIAEQSHNNKKCNDTMFNEYQTTCDLGMNAVQSLIDAFWNNPLGFAYCVHVKYKEDIINLFAGRVYDEVPSPGLIALRKINDKYTRKAETLNN